MYMISVWTTGRLKPPCLVPFACNLPSRKGNHDPHPKKSLEKSLIISQIYMYHHSLVPHVSSKVSELAICMDLSFGTPESGARRDGCPQQASSNTGDSPDPDQGSPPSSPTVTWDFLKPKRWQSRYCLMYSDVRFLPFFLCGLFQVMLWQTPIKCHCFPFAVQ